MLLLTLCSGIRWLLPLALRFLGRCFPLDIACIYDAIRTYILAGTVFGSDGYGIGSIVWAGGVVLRYAADFGCFSGGPI